MGYLPFTPSHTLEEFNKKQKIRLSSYLETVQDNWRRRSFDDYLKELVGNNKAEKELLLFRLSNSERILDLGCGFGYALLDILRNAPDNAVVVGVDIDTTALASAKKLVEKELPDCKVVSFDDGGVPDRFWRKVKGSKNKWLALYKTDAECMLKCKENTFDLIVSVNAFQYFTDKVAAFLNILRVLKEGGVAYVNTSLDDIMILENVPSPRILEEVQHLFHWRACWNPADKISERFKEEKISHNVFSMTFSQNSFAKEYLDGFTIAGNKWIKTGRLGKKKELPHYCTFLIGTLEINTSYRTISLYTEKKT